MKTNKTGFEEVKTITELNIDITREFVVVKWDWIFNTGDILKLERDDDSFIPYFKRVSDWKERCMFLYELAYADEPLKNGDLVWISDTSIEYAIKNLDLRTFISMNGDRFICEEDGYYADWKYAVKVTKEPIIEYTMEQLQEKLGETFKLIK